VVAWLGIDGVDSMKSELAILVKDPAQEKGQMMNNNAKLK
jgi:hypothetical protein